MLEAEFSTPRQRLLAVLRASDALTLAELSRITGAHVNTLREHLDALVAAGLAEAAPSPPRTRGRPPIRYRASGVRPADASMFLDALAAEIARRPDADEIAASAGERWADGVAATAATAAATRVGAATAGPDLEALMASLGFDPLPIEGGLVLRGCPAGPVPALVPEVVCRMHGAVVRRFGGAGVCLERGGHPQGCLVRVPE